MKGTLGERIDRPKGIITRVEGGGLPYCILVVLGFITCRQKAERLLATFVQYVIAETSLGLHRKRRGKQKKMPLPIV